MQTALVVVAVVPVMRVAVVARVMAMLVRVAAVSNLLAHVYPRMPTVRFTAVGLQPLPCG